MSAEMGRGSTSSQPAPRTRASTAASAGSMARQKRWGVAREVEEAEEVDVLRPLVGLAAEGDVLALVLPRGDRGEEDGAGIGARRPAVEDDGRACRPPREALERHGAVGRAQVLAVGEEDVVARQ